MSSFVKSDAAPEGDVSFSTPYGDFVVGTKPVEIDGPFASELALHPFVTNAEKPVKASKEEK